jgi:hypothetical protein
MARSFVHVLPKSISSAARHERRVATRTRSFASRARNLRRARQAPFDARARRKRAIEAHVEKTLLDVVPRLLADDEIAADVEQDVVEPASMHRSRNPRQSSSPCRTATTRESHRLPSRSRRG